MKPKPTKFTSIRIAVQHQFSQAVGRRPVQPDESAQAGEVWQRQNDFNRGRCPRTTRADSRYRATGAGIPPALQAQIDIRGCPARAAQSRHRPPAHHIRTNRHSHRKIVVGESQFAEYSDSHRTRPRDSRRFHRRARPRAACRGLFADRTPATGALFERPAAGGSLPPRR